MYVLTYTKHRWVPLVSLGFALTGGVAWTLSGITLLSFVAVSALQLSVLLPYWRARVMNKHWKKQIAGSIMFAETMIKKLHLSGGRQELEAALKEIHE